MRNITAIQETHQTVAQSYDLGNVMFRSLEYRDAPISTLHALMYHVEDGSNSGTVLMILASSEYGTNIRVHPVRYVPKHMHQSDFCIKATP